MLTRSDSCKGEYPEVSIIILNWNNYKDTNECLESLGNITYPNHEIIVIDNGSVDGSGEKLKKKFPGHTFIQNKENLGFAGGNNVGIKYAVDVSPSPYILLLNNDTTVEPDFLEPLVAFAEENKRAGSLQGKLLRKSNPKMPDSLGQMVTTIPGRSHDIMEWGNMYDDNSPQEIFGACAAAALYRVETLRQIGLFNEEFFAIFEDVDLSWRARIAGWHSFLIPLSVVYHKRGISGPTTFNSFKKRLNFRNGVYLAIRYWPAKYLIFYSPFLMKAIAGAILYCFTHSSLKEFAKYLVYSYRIRKRIKKNVLKGICKDWLVQEEGYKVYFNRKLRRLHTLIEGKNAGD